ncbi:MAG TPA: hypothetical protein ENH82_13755 [bacterium]|nr:hypothetical protein [bacterium]
MDNKIINGTRIKDRVSGLTGIVTGIVGGYRYDYTGPDGEDVSVTIAPKITRAMIQELVEGKDGEKFKRSLQDVLGWDDSFSTTFKNLNSLIFSTVPDLTMAYWLAFKGSE